MATALADDDLDRAIELGLLSISPCEACTPACKARLADARTGRMRALAARDRFQQRAARLYRLAEQRRLRRSAPVVADGVAHGGPSSSTYRPKLPGAAAAALARAKAKAAQRGQS